MIKQEKNTFLIITAHSATPAVSKHIIFFTAVLTSPKHNLDIASDLTPMCPGFKLNEFMFLLIGSGQMWKRCTGCSDASLPGELTQACLAWA